MLSGVGPTGMGKMGWGRRGSEGEHVRSLALLGLVPSAIADVEDEGGKRAGEAGDEDGQPHLQQRPRGRHQQLEGPLLRAVRVVGEDDELRVGDDAGPRRPVRLGAGDGESGEEVLQVVVDAAQTVVRI